jgi:hypothetical protein
MVLHMMSYIYSHCRTEGRWLTGVNLQVRTATLLFSSAAGKMPTQNKFFFLVTFEGTFKVFKDKESKSKKSRN